MSLSAVTPETGEPCRPHCLRKVHKGRFQKVSSERKVPEHDLLEVTH